MCYTIGNALVWPELTRAAPEYCYNTVECRYNAVQIITILHTALRWQQQNVNQTSNSRASYGVSIMRILEKVDRVITTTHCMWFRKRQAVSRKRYTSYVYGAPAMPQYCNVYAFLSDIIFYVNETVRIVQRYNSITYNNTWRKNNWNIYLKTKSVFEKLCSDWWYRCGHYYV